MKGESREMKGRSLFGSSYTEGEPTEGVVLEPPETW